MKGWGREEKKGEARGGEREGDEGDRGGKGGGLTAAKVWGNSGSAMAYSIVFS